jgi:hypothetical protein
LNKKFVKIKEICILSAVVLFIFLPANFILAQSGGNWGNWSTEDWGDDNSVTNFIKSSNVVQLANNVANYIFTLAIPLGVIMIIWAGVLFMTAAGNEQKITTARRALTWSIVGIVVAFIGKGWTTIVNNIIGGQITTTQGVLEALNRAANYIFSFAVALGVIMIIWAGVLFMSSGGSEQKVTLARRALTWGLVGAAIAIASKGIVMGVKAFLGS